MARMTKGNKLDQEIVLNATLAGGVVMGAAADLLAKPYYAMIAGFVIGSFSAFGFAYLNKFFREKIGLSDTCGVHYLHGIPGFMGAIIAAIACSNRAETHYGSRYDEFFPLHATTGRTPHEQVGYQFAGIGLTFGLAILGGLIGGSIASREWFDRPSILFDDRLNWHDIKLPKVNFRTHGETEEHVHEEVKSEEEFEKKPDRNSDENYNTGRSD